MVNLKVITGSTRPGRFNIQPAEWIYKIAKENEHIEAELLDLVEINLPFLDEEVSPSRGQYSKKHTKKWAEKIAEGDCFIFVTPEYNHSYSPVIKNAIDFAYQEWNYKPASFISYGSLTGGSRAVEHLRAVMTEIKIYDLREQILLPNYWDNLNESGEFQFTDQHKKQAEEILKELTFWAKKMKAIREELK